ncbi:hypothetical protein FKM82_021056 [Ascaphus truei]|uniref:membrane-anchored junction protein n=1 Tax=Ascaphus truei TaxID=8439 RepID=UPI003F596291
MPIKPFSFPLPETRFFHTPTDVYKFKIRYGAHFTTGDVANNETIVKELVESIRAVLANHDNLHPFATEHFIIFPYKSKWDSAPRVRFKHGHKSLTPFPDVFTIYVEPKSLLDERCHSAVNIGNENDESGDEEMQYDGSCRDLDEAVVHMTNYPGESNPDPCPSPALNARSGGILTFLMSFIPFRLLFGGKKSIE